MEEEENFQKKQTSPGKKAIYKNKEKILKLYYDGMRPKEIFERYDIPESTFFGWVKANPKSVVLKYNQKQGPADWARLKSHAEKLEYELSFLKNTIVKDYSLCEKEKIIDGEFGKGSLHAQCDALNIDRVAYINYKNRGKKNEAWFMKRRARLTALICHVHRESGRVFGAKKIAAILKKRGEIVSKEFVQEIMTENGLKSTRNSENKDYRIIARRLRKTMHPVREYKVTGMNQVWTSDITAVHIKGAYYYVCVFLDLFSRMIVAWSIGRNNSTQLSKRTFIKAYRDRGYPKGLVVHTDNGAPYTSFSFERALSSASVVHSFSRVGVPHDNAVAESFFATLKRECIYLDGYPKSYRELENMVEKYIEKYNTTRPHENLNYCTPKEYEEQKLAKKPV